MDWRATTLIWIARLTGLGLVIYALGPCARSLALFLHHVRYPRQVMTAPGLPPRSWNVLDWIDFGIDQLPPVVFLALGLHLLLGGRWLLRRMLRGLDGTCPACGHPWPDAGAVRCPECGFGVAVTGPRRGPDGANAQTGGDGVS